MKKKSRLGEAVKVLIGLSITAFALYFFFRSVDTGKILEAIRKTSPAVILACVMLTVLSLYLRSLRLGVLLPERPGADKRNLFQVVTIAFMINNVLPARLGEAARVFLLCRNNRYSVHVSLGSLAVERLMDSLFYALFIAVPSLLLLPLLAGKKFFGQVDVMVAVRFGWIAAACAISVLLLFRIFPGMFFRLGDRMAAKNGTWTGKLARHLMILFRESTEWMFSRKKSLLVLALTPAVILCYTAMIFLQCRTLGVVIGIVPVMFVAGVIAFGVAVPSSPGYVGTLHLAMREALVIFGADRDTASAVAILYHILSWAVTVLLGLYFYFKMDVSFKDIKAAKEKQ